MGWGLALEFLVLILRGVVFVTGGRGTTLLLSRFTEDIGTELNIKIQLKVKVTLVMMRFFILDTPVLYQTLWIGNADANATGNNPVRINADFVGAARCQRLSRKIETDGTRTSRRHRGAIWPEQPDSH